MLFSHILDKGADRLADIFGHIPDAIDAVVSIIVGVALLCWFAKRAFMKKRVQGKEDRTESLVERFLSKGLLAAGILHSLWAITDPPFWGVVAVASQNDSVIVDVAAFALFTIVSQLPLYVLTVAVALGKHEPVIRYIESKMTEDSKLKRALRTALTVLILIAGISFIADGVCFFATGNWLF